MTYRGFFLNKSVYQSGDPTDYTWEATSGDTGFTSSERYYTTSTGLQNTLGSPTKPGSGITWTVITAGDAVPGTATYLAKRFTLTTTTSGAITSSWNISPVGKHIDTSVVAANAITPSEISAYSLTAANATLQNYMLDTLAFAGNSVTQSVTFSNSGVVSGSATTWLTVASATINNTNSTGTTSNLISFSIFGYYTSGGNWQMEFELFRGSTKIDEGQVAMINNTAGTIVSSFAVDTNGAGSNTYTLKARGTGSIGSSVYVSLRKMYILGAKR